MFNKILSIVAILLALATTPNVFAEVTVKTEQINPASPTWSFKNIPGPSKSDIAQGAKVSLVGNQWEPAGGDGSILVNGRLPNDPLDLSEEAFLPNANANGGSIVIDLGKVQPVAAVCSYSWHENPPDQGSRGPQVYTLYGSAAENPDATNLASWIKIADVDTRPNKTGAQWNGQHGAFISNTTGKLGDYRYILLAVQSTHSPLQSNPAMANTLYGEIDVHTKETLAKAGDAVVVKSVKVTDVWVAFKTHYDIGYTDTVANVLTKFRVTMMNSAIKNFEADRKLPPEKRFSWIVPGWPITHMIGPLQDPSRKAKIEQAIREGSLALEALPFSLQTETLDLEDLVRGLGFTSHIARTYGRPLPIAAKMTDVPCHSWVLPTLLANAGVKFLQIGCNDNSGHLKVPHLFWWEGPDGSKVLCNFTERYGSGLIPPKNWPSKNYLAMIMTYDNQGPPSPGDVDSIRQQAAKYLPGVHVHFGTLDDFAKAEMEEKPELPTVRGDMPDTWVHGFMSMPIETKISHDIRPFEPALETLDTQLHAWGVTTTDLAPALAEAYEQSNLYGEHTFGPWGPKSGPWESGIRARNVYGAEWKAAMDKGMLKKYEQGFQPKRDYAFKEVAIVERELHSRLDLLAKSVKADGSHIVVYNGLPWARSGTVEIPGQSGKFLYVEDVPANGYKTIPLPQQPATTTQETDTLDTPFYKVAFDLKRGGIASLIDKKTGRELVDQSSPYALGQFLHERFDMQQMEQYGMAYSRPPTTSPGAFIKEPLPAGSTYAAMTPPSWSIAIQRSSVADVATLTATDTIGLAKGIAIVATFYHNQPGVDVQWRVTDKTPNPIPEGGWLCFPMAVEQPKFLLGRLGGPVDPAKDIVTGGNRDYLCLSTGLTISGKDQTGIGLCPVDSPCVSLDRPGLWKYSLDFVPKKPTVFVNLYNNMWNTNFPEWQNGSWTSTVRLWPTSGDDQSKNLVVPSWEARLSLLAPTADGPAGQLPKTQSGVSVSRPGVLVTAFGADPDGVNKGTLLRVWDQTGNTGEVTINLPPGFKAERATPVDLRGEKAGEPFRIGNDKITFKLPAYAPASFMLE